MKYFLLLEKFSLFVFAFVIFTGVAHAVIPSNGVLQTSNNIVYVSYDNAFIVEDVRGVSGKNVKVKITLPSNLTSVPGNKVWLRIFGLPDELSFSKGAAVSGVWFIALRDLSDLHLISPGNFNGAFSLELFLMRGDKTVVSIVARKKVKVQLVENVLTAKSGSIGDETVSKQIGSNSKPPEFEEVILLERGRQLMKKGKVLQARNVYRELADRGSAKGALALAQSYDAEGNSQEAGQWYRRAKELGSAVTH